MPEGRQGAEGAVAPDPCPICARGAPLDVIAELDTTWVTAGAEAPLAKHHVVQPFERPERERV